MTGAAAGASMGGPWGALAGGAAGFLLGSDDKSQSYYDEMLKQAQSIPLPILKEQYPELYKQVVSMNPELETAVTLGPSATEGISLDPKYKQAQMSALSKLMDITSNNGQDAQSKADNARLENQVNSNLQGNTQAIQQNMAARGMSGGMSEMVNKQLAAQQSANRQAQMGLDINAQAQQRALQALMNQSNVANQMSNTDFNQANIKAQAQDAISRFNTQNLQNVSSNNVAIKNNAQQTNNNNMQNIANKNVDLNNQAQQYNSSLAQQQFENELRKKGMINTANSNLAKNSYNQAKDQDEFLGGAFGAAAKSFGTSKVNNSSFDTNQNTTNKLPKWNPETGRYE